MERSHEKITSYSYFIFITPNMERSHGNANQQTKIIAIRSNESKAFSNSRSSTHTFLFTNSESYKVDCITTWCYEHSVLLNKLQKICNKFINTV